MRRVLVGVVASTALLGACGGSASPDTHRYYDPNGLFSAELPTANDTVMLPAQTVSGAPALLAGVLSEPSQSSPSPSNQAFGGSFIQPVTNRDTAIYAVFAVKVGKAKTLGGLGSKLLASTQTPTVVSERKVKVGGLPGVLVVTDHQDAQGNPYYSDASAFAIDGEVGYWVRVLFTTGEWDRHKNSFSDLLRSFRPEVPQGLEAVPLSRPGLLVRSGIGWPLG